MLALPCLALSAVSTLLASRCILAAPLPVNTPPHEKAGTSSSQHSNHNSPVHWYESGVPTHEKLLITSTDGKFDDKKGMTANERIGKYGHHDIHYNGLVDVEGAHAHVADWFKHMDPAGKAAGFHTSERRFYQGGTPFIKDNKPDPAAGEHLFREDHIDLHNVPLLKKLDMDDPNAHKELLHHAGKHADFFSMAPIPEKELDHKMKAYHDAGVTIDNVVHIEGYNSRQDLASRKVASDKTAAFVQNLKKKVRKFHPKANVILTHSKHNFGPDGNGATQMYTDLLGRSPFHHIQTVGEKDPFAMNQIKTATDHINEIGKRPFQFKGANNIDDITPKEMWKARRNKNPLDPETITLRDNIVDTIDKNLPLVKLNHIKYRLGSVRSGIVEGCQGETCDANHVILAHQAIAKGADGFDNVHVDKEIRMWKPEKGQEHHAITPKYHPGNKAMVTRNFKQVFPIVDREAFHEKEDH